MSKVFQAKRICQRIDKMRDLLKGLNIERDDVKRAIEYWEGQFKQVMVSMSDDEILQYGEDMGYLREPPMEAKK